MNAPSISLSSDSPFPFERDAEELTSSGVGLVLWGGGEYQYPIG